MRDVPGTPTTPARRRRGRGLSRAGVVLLGVTSVTLAGCSSGMSAIDRKLQTLVDESSREMDESVLPDTVIGPGQDTSPVVIWNKRSWTEEWPRTTNPTASSLMFTPAEQREAEQVMQRLEAYSEPPADAARFDLTRALAYATKHAREFRFAEEEYLLASLRLLIQRHMWGPRFFDDVSAVASGAGTGGDFDAALDLVNEFAVTQKLPYGGEIGARALVQATEDLYGEVVGGGVQSASIILTADVPLLRGAGQVAREDRIQAERNLIYGARAFARFRREFLFDVASNYLDLVVEQQQIENARAEVESYRELEAREAALYSAGRSTPFDLAQAQNETLSAVDRLNGAAERYRVNLDQFKVFIGMPVEEPLVIEPDQLGLPTPQVDMNTAVLAAMSYRLDLQTRRDLIEDAQRGVENARNGLLGDLDVSASFAIPTDPTVEHAGLGFDAGYSSWEAGVTYGLPLDREIERLEVRESQITLARLERAYAEFRDTISTNVRAAVRGIDSALFSLQIQEANVRIALQRQESIAADPARATIRQKTDAINQTARARDARDGARRDLQVAVLGYLLASGQLRVDAEGFIEPLEGMHLEKRDQGREGAEEIEEEEGVRE